MIVQLQIFQKQINLDCLLKVLHNKTQQILIKLNNNNKISQTLLAK